MSKSTVARVTGIGGIFFKAHHRKQLLTWYSRHLGLPVENEWGGCIFDRRVGGNPRRTNYTVWSAFDAETDYFGPSRKPFMVNFRVPHLDALLKQLEKEGVWIDPKREDTEFGRFAWIMDCEGNRIELWEPPVAGKRRLRARATNHANGNGNGSRNGSRNGTSLRKPRARPKSRVAKA